MASMGRSNDGDRELFDNVEDDNDDAKIIVDKKRSRSASSYGGPPRREPAAPSHKCTDCLPSHIETSSRHKRSYSLAFFDTVGQRQTFNKI